MASSTGTPQDRAAESAGPFWDVMEGRAAPPPAGELLGWRLEAVDPDRGTIAVSFGASDRFLNPFGTIQGGLLAAMLDDTLGPALVATLGPGQSRRRPTSTSSSCVQRRPAGSGDRGASCGAAATSPSWPATCSTTGGRSSPPPPRPPRSGYRSARRRRVGGEPRVGAAHQVLDLGLLDRQVVHGGDGDDAATTSAAVVCRRSKLSHCRGPSTPVTVVAFTSSGERARRGRPPPCGGCRRRS